MSLDKHFGLHNTADISACPVAIPVLIHTMNAQLDLESTYFIQLQC